MKTDISLKGFIPYIIIVVLTLIIGWLWFGRKPVKESTSQYLTVSSVQAVGRLELVRMHLKNVVEHTVEHSRFLPDTRLLMVVSGELAGCIDLQKIKESDIVQEDSLVTVHLPAPEICFSRIDHKKSQIYSVVTIPVLDNESLIVQEMYRKAEASFLNDELRQEVFRQTERNASVILTPLLEKLSGKRVKLVFDKQPLKN
ncbi:MAG: DUF4230 domain-containing protein [Sediminibacterium sp.]|nr:DUF4230 domain-containing protein [Sediminibacterium sp.]